MDCRYYVYTTLVSKNYRKMYKDTDNSLKNNPIHIKLEYVVK